MRVSRHPVQGVFQDVCPAVTLVVDEFAFIGELHDESFGGGDSSWEHYSHPRFVEVFRHTSVVGGPNKPDRFAGELNRCIRCVRFTGQQCHGVYVLRVVWHDRIPANVGHLKHWRETETNRVERLVGLDHDRGGRLGVTISLQGEVDVSPWYACQPRPRLVVGCQRPW